MARTMAEQLKQAFAEAGRALPDSRPGQSPPSRKQNTLQAGPHAAAPSAPAGRKSQSKSVKSRTVGKSASSLVRAFNARCAPAGTPLPGNTEKRTVPAAHAPQPPQRRAPCPVEICVGDNPSLALSTGDAGPQAVPRLYAAAGIPCQCRSADSWSEERELVLGLDFGTSAVKVVIGDRALGKAFAVPFTDQSGLQRYLLPCRLYESDGVFDLSGGATVHRDLKLALAAFPDDLLLQARVTAFLALVIRHVRGWLLMEKEPVYRNVRIVWKLVLGLPVAHQLESKLAGVFKEAAGLAWVTSVGPRTDISLDCVKLARQTLPDLVAGVQAWPDGADVEVDAVPEIAAQIYGFVTSQKFDRKAKNYFLMVDVGAGTVDSSLFHVKPGRGGRWDFEFFTCVVEPHGTMNLHRHRVRWWQQQLALSDSQQGRYLAEELGGHMCHTDQLYSVPDTVDGYVRDVSIARNDPKACPDADFFRRRVVAQVRGNTYWRTWKDGHLDQHILRDIPAFYCGGGTRMNFYSRLRTELASMPGCTWLKAAPRHIALPEELEAPGLMREDYDRLSVAYGLSFLEVGKITRAAPKPRLIFEQETPYHHNYVSKDDV